MESSLKLDVFPFGFFCFFYANILSTQQYISSDVEDQIGVNVAGHTFPSIGEDDTISVRFWYLWSDRMLKIRYHYYLDVSIYFIYKLDTKSSIP